MKKILYSLILLFTTFSFTSCLDSNLDDLPEYGDADITSVSAVNYRYFSDEKSPVSGEPIVEEVNLEYTADIDAKKGEIKIKVTKPKDFPENQEDKLSKSNLVVIVSLSTAARLQPLEGSSKLGVPSDWNKVNSYVVTSASGQQKNWSIEVISLTK